MRFFTLVASIIFLWSLGVQAAPPAYTSVVVPDYPAETPVPVEAPLPPNPPIFSMPTPVKHFTRCNHRDLEAALHVRLDEPVTIESDPYIAPTLKQVTSYFQPRIDQLQNGKIKVIFKRPIKCVSEIKIFVDKTVDTNPAVYITVLGTDELKASVVNKRHFDKVDELQKCLEKNYIIKKESVTSQNSEDNISSDRTFVVIDPTKTPEQNRPDVPSEEIAMNVNNGFIMLQVMPQLDMDNSIFSSETRGRFYSSLEWYLPQISFKFETKGVAPLGFYSDWVQFFCKLPLENWGNVDPISVSQNLFTSAIKASYDSHKAAKIAKEKKKKADDIERQRDASSKTSSSTDEDKSDLFPQMVRNIYNAYGDIKARYSQATQIYQANRNLYQLSVALERDIVPRLQSLAEQIEEANKIASSDNVDPAKVNKFGPYLQSVTSLLQPRAMSIIGLRDRVRAVQSMQQQQEGYRIQ